MTVKLCGACLMLLLAALLASRGSAALRERVAVLEGFLSLLRYIREKIACFRTPAPDIFESFHCEALSRTGFLTQLRDGGMLFALEHKGDGLYLDGEAMALLSEFAAELGGGYAEEELARCELAISRLSDILASYKESLPKSTKLYRTLMLSGTLAVIIVLL